MLTEALALPRTGLAGEKTAWLKLIAYHDELTGLYNRRYLRSHFPYAGGSSATRQPITLIFLDLDGFKGINDQHGHAVGNEVLCEVARILREAVGFDGLAFRLGGDEFAATLLTDEPSRAQEVVDEVRLRLAESGVLPMPGVNAGWAVFPEEGRSLEDVLLLSDQRMCEDKRRRQAPRSNLPEETAGREATTASRPVGTGG